MTQATPITTSGIVLRCYPLPKRDAILHVFTKDLGRIKIVVKQTNRNHNQLRALTSPFVEAEWIVTPGRGDLHRLVDGSIINLHMALRDALKSLETAGRLTRAIETSQWLWKPAPGLYALLRLSLAAVPRFDPLEVLETAFLLKILKYEGLIGVDADCATCQVPLTETEWSSVSQALDTRSLTTLQAIEITPALRKKVYDWFCREIEDRRNADGGI